MKSEGQGDETDSQNARPPNRRRPRPLLDLSMSHAADARGTPLMSTPCSTVRLHGSTWQISVAAGPTRWKRPQINMPDSPYTRTGYTVPVGKRGSSPIQHALAHAIIPFR